MSGRVVKARKFRNRDQRDAHFRGMVARTDRKARRNRELWELDQARIEAGPLGAQEQWERDKRRLMDRIAGPLPSQPSAPQAER